MSDADAGRVQDIHRFLSYETSCSSLMNTQFLPTQLSLSLIFTEIDFEIIYWKLSCSGGKTHTEFPAQSAAYFYPLRG